MEEPKEERRWIDRMDIIYASYTVNGRDYETSNMIQITGYNIFDE
jgi:hypothetical protein